VRAHVSTKLARRQIRGLRATAHAAGTGLEHERGQVHTLLDHPLRHLHDPRLGAANAMPHPADQLDRPWADMPRD
jgi:hypothetical protein